MCISISATYDQTGAVDYRNVIYAAKADYKKLTRWAGIMLLNTFCRPIKY
jgi:hypothetical protein